MAELCETCGGNGQNPAWPLSVCPVCDGTGTDRASIGDTPAPQSTEGGEASEPLEKRIGECEGALEVQERIAAAYQADARRYEYLLDCEVTAARKYLPGLNADEFKAKRRAAHDAALGVAMGGEGQGEKR